MFRLPNLVFAEFHEDPATAQTLERIMPKLIELGYGEFLDELPKSWKKKDAINYFKKQEKEYADLLKIINEWNEKFAKEAQLNIDLSDLSHIDDNTLTEDQKLVLLANIAIVESAIKSVLPTIPMATTLNHQVESGTMIGPIALRIQLLLEIIFRHTSRLHYINLLEKGLNDQIDYRGIDAMGFAITTSGLDKEIKNPARDDSMTKAYLNATRPAVGRIGLLHALGIQERVIKQLKDNTKLADARFCFFHLYSKPKAVYSIELKALSPDYETVINLENAARSNDQNFYPLGIVPIDINGKSDNELVTLITAEIEKRKNAFSNASLSIRNEMAQELDFYVIKREEERKSKHSEYNSFFGRFSGMKASIKISAASKARLLLNGTGDEIQNVTFTPNEIKALHDGRLGKLIKKIEFYKTLPELKVEPVKQQHHKKM